MRLFFFILLLTAQQFSFAQTIDKIINATEVERIEKVLSADDMRGRMIFTPDIDKAAAFISDEFKKAGLQPYTGKSFLQEFNLLRTKVTSISGQLNGDTISGKNLMVYSAKTELSVNQSSGYEKINVNREDSLRALMARLLRTGKNYVLVLDTSLRDVFEPMKRVRPYFSPLGNIVMILTNDEVKSFSVKFKQEVTERPLKNVAGILPGKSKKDEYVIFSAHYDHKGVGRANAAGDSIYNGANDDAAGCTAVMMLADYFAKQKNNERTIIFVTFTGEENGGYGSRYFSQHMNPASVVAMFNIEMIGTESKWGTNSAYITGYEKTDMGKILEKNLNGTGFTFYADPYPDQNLFYRSDNATLARQGVPAHTISTSKMDSEKYYHTQEDEIETLDMKNMAAIIKAIAISSTSIIAGKDTPTRVDANNLR